MVQRQILFPAARQALITTMRSSRCARRCRKRPNYSERFAQEHGSLPIRRFQKQKLSRNAIPSAFCTLQAGQRVERFLNREDRTNSLYGAVEARNAISQDQCAKTRERFARIAECCLWSSWFSARFKACCLNTQHLTELFGNDGP